MDIQLGKLIQRFQHRTKNAHEKLGKLAKLIGHEVQEDVKDNKIFEQKLDEFGVDEKYADELAKEEEEEEQEQDDDASGRNQDDAPKQGKIVLWFCVQSRGVISNAVFM